MTKKILFITPTFSVGGSEKYLLDVFDTIDFKDNDVTLYVDQNKVEMIDKVPKDVKVVIGNFDFKENSHIDIVFLKIIKTVFEKLKIGEKFVKKYKRYSFEKKLKLKSDYCLGKEKYDIALINLMFSNAEIINYIHADKKMLIYHMSNDNHHENMLKILPNLDRVITVSEPVVSMLKSKYPGYDNISLIPNVVNAEIIRSKATESNSLLVNEENILILATCGRFSSEKGYDIAVKSAKLLKESGLNFIWYFIGDGEQRSNIENLIAENNLKDNIILTGMLDNPYPVIGSSNIYVQTSYEEADPRTIKEALILNKYVVSTKTMGAQFSLQDKDASLCDFDEKDVFKAIYYTASDKKYYIHQIVSEFTKEDFKKEWVKLWLLTND